jgi:hypothetical protein
MFDQPRYDHGLSGIAQGEEHCAPDVPIAQQIGHDVAAITPAAAAIEQRGQVQSMIPRRYLRQARTPPRRQAR